MPIAQHASCGLAAAITALTLCATHAVGAQLTTQASLQNFTVELTDLNPDDGIAPALSWINGSGDLYLQGWELQGPSTFPNLVQVVSRSSQPPGLFPSAEIAQEGYSAQITKDSAALSVVTPLGQQVRAGAKSTAGFTLTPFTALTIRAQSSIGIEGILPDGASMPPPSSFLFNSVISMMASTSIHASFNSLTPSFPGQPGESGSDGGTGQLLVRGPGSPLQVAGNEALSITLGNLTASTRTGTLGYITTISGYSQIPVVPEPGTWIQMGLGLAGVLALSRRLKQREALAARKG